MFIAVMAVAVTGCGKKEGATSSNTQVVAKVNGDEISIHQVNFQLSRLGQLNEEQSKAAAKDVLARLVDQQILKQKAIDAKLDRDPRVLQALEATKDQILAQAYLEQEMNKAAKPSASDIDKFYTEHPELFQNRRLFNLQELAVEADKDKFTEIEQAISGKKSLTEIGEWLKSKGYKFAVNANVRAAEQLPLPVLLKLQPLKDGDTVAIQNSQSINIVHLAASQSQPIARDKAKPVIEQYFLNQNKTELVKKQVEGLKKAAKIEYVGAFADMKKAEAITPAATGVDHTKTSTTSEVLANPPSAAAESSQTTAKSSAKQSNIDKGLSGL